MSFHSKTSHNFFVNLRIGQHSHSLVQRDTYFSSRARILSLKLLQMLLTDKSKTLPPQCSWPTTQIFAMYSFQVKEQVKHMPHNSESLDLACVFLQVNVCGNDSLALISCGRIHSCGCAERCSPDVYNEESVIYHTYC